MHVIAFALNQFNAARSGPALLYENEWSPYGQVITLRELVLVPRWRRDQRGFLQCRAHEMGEASPRCVATIDCVCEAPEPNALLVKRTNQIQRVLYASSEPVQFPAGQGVAFAHEALRRGRAVFGSTTSHLSSKTLLQPTFIKASVYRNS